MRVPIFFIAAVFFAVNFVSAADFPDFNKSYNIIGGTAAALEKLKQFNVKNAQQYSSEGSGKNKAAVFVDFPENNLKVFIKNSFYPMTEKIFLSFPFGMLEHTDRPESLRDLNFDIATLMAIKISDVIANAIKNAEVSGYHHRFGHFVVTSSQIDITIEILQSEHLADVLNAVTDIFKDESFSNLHKSYGKYFQHSRNRCAEMSLLEIEYITKKLNQKFLDCSDAAQQTFTELSFSETMIADLEKYALAAKKKHIVNASKVLYIETNDSADAVLKTILQQLVAHLPPSQQSASPDIQDGLKPKAFDNELDRTCKMIALEGTQSSRAGEEPGLLLHFNAGEYSADTVPFLQFLQYQDILKTEFGLLESARLQQGGAQPMGVETQADNSLSVDHVYGESSSTLLFVADGVNRGEAYPRESAAWRLGKLLNRYVDKISDHRDKVLQEYEKFRAAKITSTTYLSANVYMNLKQLAMKYLHVPASQGIAESRVPPEIRTPEELIAGMERLISSAVCELAYIANAGVSPVAGSGGAGKKSTAGVAMMPSTTPVAESVKQGQGQSRRLDFPLLASGALLKDKFATGRTKKHTLVWKLDIPASEEEENHFVLISAYMSIVGYAIENANQRLRTTKLRFEAFPSHVELDFYGDSRGIEREIQELVDFLVPFVSEVVDSESGRSKTSRSYSLQFQAPTEEAILSAQRYFSMYGRKVRLYELCIKMGRHTVGRLNCGPLMAYFKERPSFNLTISEIVGDTTTILEKDRPVVPKGITKVTENSVSSAFAAILSTLNFDDFIEIQMLGGDVPVITQYVDERQYYSVFYSAKAKDDAKCEIKEEEERANAEGLLSFIYYVIQDTDILTGENSYTQLDEDFNAYDDLENLKIKSLHISTFSKNSLVTLKKAIENALGIVGEIINYSKTLQDLRSNYISYVNDKTKFFSSVTKKENTFVNFFNNCLNPNNKTNVEVVIVQQVRQ